ncbi:hypothetical protein PybrP1_008228 [[Pythium] brassicae (nom. inval.)]|nr:hypothetical protein PybrP1_008228 [[Pythium] brassicae (nom. inval.)]
MPASLYEPSASPVLAPAAAGASSSSSAAAAAVAPPSSSPSAAGSTIHCNLSVKYEFNAGALAVDATGALGVLAGRKGLHLVDLEAPFVPAATLHHQTKWDVSVVKCHPLVPFRAHVASTSNHNTLIWSIAHALGDSGSSVSSGAPQQQPLLATLRAHTRPVSDVAWSPADPWVLATCSADTKTHLWDIRTPPTPVLTLCAFSSSATQVAWSRVDGASLATAHDGDVRVWDTRASGGASKGPAVTITAHMQKIYGLDWHPTRADELVTCSEDKTVKFWDVAQPRVCQGQLATGAPVWRARYTPFGDGLVTSAHRLDTSLRLWALSHAEPGGGGGLAVDPVHTFAGHSDLVKGFVWRARPGAGVFQLVSWAKNQELRLWRIDAPHLEACGYDAASDADAARAEPSAERLRADGARYRLASKYDLSALRTDFVPLVVPPTAVPLGASEYSLDGHAASMNALLVFDEDLAKIGAGDAGAGDDDSSAHAATASVAAAGGGGGSGGAKPGHDTTAAGGSARALPCPRFSGASFSGPNMLLVFDSRVAIGQTRSSAVPAAAVAAGKPVKAPAPPPKLPRTYEELLDLRDSRFATKKNKKAPVKLLSSANVLGAMDMASGDWGPHDLMLDAAGGGGTGLFGDDMDASVHGYRASNGLFFSSTMAASSPLGGGGGDHHDKSVHGGSEYLKAYFANSEYHLPINHPEHRISVPVLAGNGSPRNGPGAALRERSKRLDQAPGASLNLDLSLSVTVLDLSKICGVSSILTYKTEIAPRKLEAPSPRDSSDGCVDARGPPAALESGSRSLLSWMLQASERVSGKGSFGRVHPAERLSNSATGETTKTTTTPPHLSSVLQSLLQPQTHSSGVSSAADREEAADAALFATPRPTHSVSNTCAHNAHVAALAGRPDLQKVWSLLEISTAPAVDLPLYREAQPLAIASTHPWSAHPFGKRLVDKILGVYEQAGDLPTVASIVCALAPRNDDDDALAARSEYQNSVADPARKATLGSTSGVGGGSGSGGGFVDFGSTTFVSSSDDEFYAVTSSTFDGMRSRRSSNALSQLAEELGDAPPAMKHTRRSISHTDVGRGSFGERPASGHVPPAVVSALRISKDWPVPSTANRVLSPVRTPPSSSSSSRMTPKGASLAAGWRVESPFKTWSGASVSKEASPRRALTNETFQSPIPSIMERSTLGDDPQGPPATHATDAADPLEDDDALASDRIALQLSYRSAEDSCLLSAQPADEQRYDVYKTSYADLLFRYGAMDLRADVLKTVAVVAPEHDGIAFGLLCRTCQTPTDDPVCGACHDFAVKCSVCQLVVRGQSMFCMTCGHGGHAAHLREWFEFEAACPTGCGCWCKTSTTSLAPFPLTEPALQEPVPSRSYSF